MNRLTHLAAAVLVASAGASLFAAQQKPATHEHETMKPLAEATADIKGDGITGTLDLVEHGHGTAAVDITLTAKGLKPGLHGVHLHAIGKCEPDFTAAGGHFDPGPNSNTDPDANHPFHMGDIPNLEVGANGSGTLKATTSRVTISRTARCRSSMPTAARSSFMATPIRASPASRNRASAAARGSPAASSRRK